MNIKQALLEVIDDSGMTRYAVAKALNKKPHYIYNLMGKATNPSYGVISKIVDACGYNLALIKRDGSRTILLDPPERG